MTENIAEPLLKWYDKNKRILPWRDKDNAYYAQVEAAQTQAMAAIAPRSRHSFSIGW